MRAYSLITTLFACVVSASAAGPAPEIKSSAYVCTTCHKTFKPQGAWDKAHPEVKLQHMNDSKHCVLCHDAASPDRFVMLDGNTLAVAESSKICSQCHGLKYRDWQNGIHGKFQHKGFPDAHRLDCVACHEPHSPKFKPMTAVPAPKRPKFHKEKRVEHGFE